MGIAGGPSINTNLLALLPKAEIDPVVSNAMARVERRFERHLTLLVGAPDFEGAKDAADYVARQLRDSGRFRALRIDGYQGIVGRAVAFYFPLRFQTLDNESREQLEDMDEAAFERAVLRRYFTPRTTVTSQIVTQDPLLLLPAFLEERTPELTDRPQIQGSYLTVESDEKTYIVIFGELAETPFSVSAQGELMPLLNGFRSRLPEITEGAEILIAGVLPHAAAGTESAITEMSIVSSGSLVGIILLLVVVFRSSRPFILTLLSISLGSLGGFAACQIILGEVHLLTLLFGASLVGISVDYSLHFFCERFRYSDDWQPAAALHRILPGITLGLITSVIGFAGLLLAPFPGMQGMAIFSSVGLVIAYGSVVICYPAFCRSLRQPGIRAPLRWVRAYGALWQRDWGIGAWAGLILFAALSFLGCFWVSATDDVRLLQTPDPEVIAEEARVRAMIGRNLASQFFLIEGQNEAEYLAREETLTEELRALQESGQLEGYIAISDFVASPQRQVGNRDLLAPLITGNDGMLRRIARQVGLPNETVDAYSSAFRNAADNELLTIDDWLASPISEPYRHLWLGQSARGVVAMVGLRGVFDTEALQTIAAADPSLHFMDPAGEISQLFGQYRQQTVWLTLLSYCVVLLLLMARYGVRGGILVMAAPAIAAAASLSATTLLGESISLFNIMALLLVLGIGVDYALFYRETGARGPTTLLAIALSAITTLLAFGLLALSATTAVHAFGMTILVGIFVAFLLSPMAGWHAEVARPGSNTQKRGGNTSEARAGD